MNPHNLHFPTLHNGPHKLGIHYHTVDRARSPLTSARDDRKVSPIKYQNVHPHLIHQQTMEGRGGGSQILQKQNSRIDGTVPVGAVQTQGTLAVENRGNAIDRVIQNCRKVSGDWETQPLQQGFLPHKAYQPPQQAQLQRRASVPVIPHNPNPQPYFQPHTHTQQAQSQVHYYIPKQHHPVQPVPHSFVQPSPECSSVAQPMCINKDNKKAKYAKLENPNQVFCSKCSIALVGTGVKMVELETPQNTRQKELKGFIAEVNNIKNTIAKQMNSMQGEKARISTHTRDQRDQLNHRYAQIANILKEFHTRDIGLITQFQQQAFMKLADYEQEFKKAWDRLDLMVKDICPNIEMIKAHISEEQFRQFMQDYQSQISSICGRIDTFNSCCVETRPLAVRKDIGERFNYDSLTQLFRENTNALFFSFEKKFSEREEVEVVGGTPIRIQGESWKGDKEQEKQQPFRVLFCDEAKEEEIPSPTFKKY